MGMHIQLSGEDRASERSTHKCQTAERQVPMGSGVHGRFDGAEANRDQEVHGEKWQYQRWFTSSMGMVIKSSSYRWWHLASLEPLW